MRVNDRSFFGELYNSRNVLQQLVAQQLILRYRRTALGYLWTLINPLLMMSVMAVVFSALFKTDLKTFTVFLFAGMIPWNFFNSVVTQSGSSFINNEGLIKKIYLPKVVFPLSIASALLIDSALSFLALFAIIIAIGGSLSWAVLFTPVAYVLLFFFALGIALIVSITTVFFRDLQHVILIAMQGLFFLTPILYQHDALVGRVGWVVGLNPVVPFIELFRAPLYLARLPSAEVVVQASLLAALAMAIGLLVFQRHQKKIVFRL
ncbi:MAG: ABC transporter permease [Candidatus Accumulibacter sp.]|uniref:ABC transporter permease n=1 Tax=Accumulibacter sp. TaxID=2053492 RepID=UPI0019F92586|nr:ABC transporter permease [Accumulibacter sp.]MBE2258263.1 ABC transporter permease [Paracoccaceae bacterium]MCB1941056.1 ABC transporter permease [Accumulibacter sp.]MCP5247128.1 ABC transporter permease [Accumulibacter sp.]